MRILSAIGLVILILAWPWSMAQATPITAAEAFVVAFPALTPAPALDDPGTWDVNIQYFADGTGTLQLALFTAADLLQSTPLLSLDSTFGPGSAGTGVGGLVINPLGDSMLMVTVGGPGSLDLASATLNFLSHDPATLNQVTSETLTFPTTHVASVPEPSGLWPLAVGLLGLGLLLSRWRATT